MEEFYLSTGSADPILIELPKKFSKAAARKGKVKSYPVLCRYNPRREDLVLFKLAQASLKRGPPNAVHKALTSVEQILARYPQHRGARIAKLECLCLITLYIPNPRSKPEILLEALPLGADLVKEDPNDWRAFALNGIALAFSRQWGHAAHMFARAITLDREGLTGSLWGLFICLLTGTHDPVVVLAEQIALKHVKDCNAWAFYGLCFYLVRDFEAAERTLSIAIAIDNAVWFVWIAATLVFLATNRAEDAFNAYQRANRLIGEAEAFLPGLAILAESRVAEKTLMTDSFIQRARKLLEEEDEKKDWLQAAIILLDREPVDLTSLTLALRFFHPLLLLAPWLPLLDPLRKHPDFERLMRESNGFLAIDL